jgi:hypothetical protein
MSIEAGAELVAAAGRTMRAGARVTVNCRTSVPGFEACSELSGVVDFDSDRCRLTGRISAGEDSAPQEEILDGSTSYSRQADGCWTFTTGAVGTHGMLHRVGLLLALIDAQSSVHLAKSGTYEVDLDYEQLNDLSDIGLAPDWESTATVECSREGRVSAVTCTHRSREDPVYYIEIRCWISEPSDVGEVALPDAKTTIALREYVATDN